MELNTRSRVFYQVEIPVEDADGNPVTDLAWEASFDHGATWVAGQQTPGKTWWRWLVAGPQADPTGATVVSASVAPALRCVDSPEIEVIDGPRIRLVTS